MKRILVIFLLTIIYINISYQLNGNMASSSQKNSSANNKEKLIKCKVCQEMFEFNFNFDEFIKSNNVLNLKNTFGLIEDNKDELETYFSNDNMEFITKEISMQYFFKGTESEFDEASAKNKECKTMKSGNQEICDKLKFEACEKVLSYENGTCVNFKKTFAEIFNSLKSNRFVNKSRINSKQSHENEFISINRNKLNSSLGDMKTNISDLLNKIKMPVYNMKNDLNENRVPIENNSIALQKQKLNNFIFKQKNLQDTINLQQHGLELETDNLLSQYGNMSLIELKQESINPNINTISFESHDNLNNKSRTWTPPKPVLLDNFQSNIGNQLKEISILTR
jgi:hypothetical protein